MSFACYFETEINCEPEPEPETTRKLVSGDYGHWTLDPYTRPNLELNLT